MNKADWESRLAKKQKHEKALWVKLSKVQAANQRQEEQIRKEIRADQADIADCFVHIEGIRQREARASRKQGRPKHNKREA